MSSDSLIHLAFSIHNNPGAYALLLGSGISRAASIPTGHEVTLEMIRQLSALNGDSPDDLEKWYFEKFGKKPEYSDLLDRLGKTQTERHGFLRPFFEPTEQEREEGKKQPTTAHKAIAKMVASGKIRVIITTNFDRLIEQAIQDEGITPTVIASADAAEGAVPLVHSRCTVIKINGDYLDTRAKNTVDELDQYDARLVRLLNQVFDEFGLLVCGWSGDWDKALRACIESTKGRRYACYWCVKREPTECADFLMSLRAAERIQIESADKFFSALEDKLESLTQLNRPHPLSAPLAVASLKRYIVEDKYRIQLHDLLMDETNRVCARLSEERYPMTGSPVPNGETMQLRINQYAADLSILLPLVINLCIWGEAEHEDLCLKVLERVTKCTPDGGGYDVWRALRFFPATLLLCAGGIAAVYSKKFGLLSKLLTGFKIKTIRSELTIMETILPYLILNQQTGQQLPGKDRQYTPINNVVFDILRPFFSDLVPSNEEYEAAFDCFEYLSALVYIDKTTGSSDEAEHVWAAPGRFAWKRGFNDHISKVIENELSEQGVNWPPIRAGLFSGKLDRAKKCKDRLDKFTSQLRWAW